MTNLHAASIPSAPRKPTDEGEEQELRAMRDDLTREENEDFGPDDPRTESD